MFKKIIVILLTIIFLGMFVASASATTYTVSNSTDVTTINKMISGKIPIKNNNFIKNGDVVKFKPGNYKNLQLIVKKSITITKTNKKAKVTFIGNNTGTAINLTNKNKKVNINNIKIRNYKYGISGIINSAKITKMTFYKNSFKGISIKGSKLKITHNKFSENEISITVRGKNNIISSNKINKRGSYSPLILINGNNNLISYNKIKAPESYAITVNGNKNKINKNTVYRGRNGIDVRGDRNLISYNKVNYIDSYDGIYIYGKYSTVKYNNVKNSARGLNIWGEKNTASYNKFYKNEIGIKYFEGNKLFKNKFKDNKKNIKLDDKGNYELYY
ncbi:right-handed parallel beta-helix repeat-containing protein [Methanobrevibacter curvatus]|uniref:Right handed beta helix domain-containing protein n=1 Tax=Methanobrevibacter curvatus TaxID=49547 RepID=A0A166CKG8_9EURY|nr:right-handed parallel beta-helix repeat-containing protein [Methanobrevibacter curvatus]KZX14603.1 hypothetical protein MBCUR_04240 [Methanobrevibacter curvatus]